VLNEGSHFHAELLTGRPISDEQVLNEGTHFLAEFLCNLRVLCDGRAHFVHQFLLDVPQFHAVPYFSLLNSTPYLNYFTFPFFSIIFPFISSIIFILMIRLPMFNHFCY
jgi:hypothetical protein